MRYCPLSDLLQAVPEATLIALSNDDPQAAAVDEAIVERAGTYADELIDAALRGRYTLPLDTTPTTVREIAATLMRHWLYARRPEGGIPEAVQKTFDASMKLLDKIRDGKLSLGLPTGEVAPKKSSFKVKASRRRFGDDVLETKL